MRSSLTVLIYCRMSGLEASQEQHDEGTVAGGPCTSPKPHKRDSPSCRLNDVISALSFTVLPGGKYLLRKALESVSQVVKELGSSFYSQSLALSLSEKGKSRSLIASLNASLILMVSHLARNLRRCTLGFSDGCPANCSCSTKDMSAGRARNC